MFIKPNRFALCALTRGVVSLALICCGGAVTAQQAADQQPAGAESDSAEPAAAPTQVDLDSGELQPRPDSELIELLQGRKGYRSGEGGYMAGEQFGKRHGRFILEYERFRPNIGLWGGAQNSTGLSDQEGEFSFWEIGTAQEGKIVSGPDTFFTYGGLFNMRDYDFDELTGIADMRLYMMFLEMGGGRFLTEDLLLEGHFQPGLATDFGGTITSNQWKWFGDVIGTWRSDKSLYWKFGLRADNTLREMPVYPMLGVTWLMNAQWRLDVLAPRYLELAWSPIPEFTLRGGAKLQGMKYGYHRTTAQAGTENDLEALTQEFRIYFDGVWQAHDLSSVTARVGGTLGGNYDIERPAGAGRFEGQVENAFFFELLFGASF